MNNWSGHAFRDRRDGGLPALYGDGALWVRPLAMFTETVERDGQVQPRFAWIGE